MAYQSPGLVVLKQNVLQRDDVQLDAGSTQTIITGSWQNAFRYSPSQPAVTVDGLGTKTVIINLVAQNWNLDSIAIIDPHCNVYDLQTGDCPVERPMQYRVRYGSDGSSTAFSYTSLSTTMLDRWGTNFFRTFLTILTNKVYIDFAMISGSESWTLSVGAILMGKRYIFPGNPGIPYGRSLRMSTIYAGREDGPTITIPRHVGTRQFSPRVRFQDEDSRADFERLLAGRGRPRGIRELTRQRLDIQTAYVSPEMWVDTTNSWGSCAFGRFTGFASQTGLAGSAFGDLAFVEMV